MVFNRFASIGIEYSRANYATSYGLHKGRRPFSDGPTEQGYYLFVECEMGHMTLFLGVYR